MLMVIHGSPKNLVDLKILDFLVDHSGECQMVIADISNPGDLLAEAKINAWPASVIENPKSNSAAGPRIVVERYFDSPMTQEEIRSRESRGDWCLDIHGVTFLRSYLSLDHRHMICIYAAPDVESVRIAQRTIGLPVTRVWGEATTTTTQEHRSHTARVWLVDTTLRDGLTDRQVAMEDKLRLLRQVDKIGVDAIEVGMTTTSPHTDDLLKDCLACVEQAIVTVLAPPDPKAIDRAGQALAGTNRPRLYVYNSTADKISINTNRATTALNERRLDEIHTTVAKAKSCCRDIQWAALDATRAEQEFLCSAVSTAIAAGASTVTVSDTRGQALPEEIRTLCSVLYERVPELHDVRLSTHFHNDLGCATANVITALQAGARQVEGTIGGLGPHGGNTDLAGVVNAIRSRKDVLALSSQLDISMVEELQEELTAVLSKMN